MKFLFLSLLPLVAIALATPDLAHLQRMIARFAPTDLRVDTSGLSPGDRQALIKLIQAARVMNDAFLDQYWAGNRALSSKLRQDTSPLGRARDRYFWINKSPWSQLDGYTAFIPNVPARKPLGANFYPEDLNKQEFEAWVAGLPQEQRRQAEGFFSVIRRRGHQLEVVPYSREYRDLLQKSANLLREAAALTPNSTLKHFLTSRADAFLTDDYYASDVAWMDLDAPLDITIGPYETYNDELFGYKASFEAYVNLRDDAETDKLKFFAAHLQDVENNLPIDARYRNPTLGALAPIRVVNQIFASGDGDHGIKTAAYNLPNDERVLKEKGSKRVMLKNVQEAKFRTTLVPISTRVLPRESQGDLSFDAFFTHIVAHELTHGIGPHQITASGRQTSPRLELKELYSAIEEAKADVTGLFLLDHLAAQGTTFGFSERQLYTTYLASAFRTLRFGLQDAHAKGMAMQFNYFEDHGAFLARPDGTFAADIPKFKAAVRGITRDLLMLEATGDYAGAKRMLDQAGVIRPTLAKVLNALKDLPTDIDPVFVRAEQIAP
jgi:hypothetical protein